MLLRRKDGHSCWPLLCHLLEPGLTPLSRESRCIYPRCRTSVDPTFILFHFDVATGSMMKFSRRLVFTSLLMTTALAQFNLTLAISELPACSVSFSSNSPLDQLLTSLRYHVLHKHFPQQAALLRISRAVFARISLCNIRSLPAYSCHVIGRTKSVSPRSGSPCSCLHAESV